MTGFAVLAFLALVAALATALTLHGLWRDTA